MLDIDTAKSYKFEETLVKAIAEKFGSELKFMVVRNRAGRFTAIFAACYNPTLQGGAFPAFAIATAGFKVFA